MLQKYLTKPTGNVLEISSGTGQHITFIAPNFPNLTFQPSEYDLNMLQQIKLYVNDCSTKNVRQPLHIDITKPIESWGLEIKKYDYIININMVHISPYICAQNLFKKAGILLNKDGLLITYGPYAVNGVLKPQSNVDFDTFLRQQNPEWGVRDVKNLKDEARTNGLILTNMDEMPANNKCLIWQKQ